MEKRNEVKQNSGTTKSPCCCCESIEYYKMRVNELEKAAIFVNKVMEMIDNTKQRYNDLVINGRNESAKLEAKNKWVAVNDLEKEIAELREGY
jgi:hypothetical protein